MAFSFGGAKPGGSFGAPTTFGATAAPTTSTAFGTPTAGFSFGAGLGATATTTAAAPAFGFGAATTTAAAPAFGFGATMTTAAAPAFGFGATTTTAAAPAFGFGATATTAAAPAFGFPAATTTGAPAFGFGTTTTTTTSGFGTGFGQAAKPPAFGFGASTTALTTATTTTSAAVKPFSFGSTPATAVQTAVKPFSFGGTTVVSAAPGGLGGAKFSAPAFVVTSANQPSLNLGLGGTTTTSSGGINDINKNDPKALKETQIPQEILTTVDEFKKLVKEERGISSDIAHISSRIHEKIKTETESLGRLVSVLSSGLKKNKAALDKLKLEAAQELLNAEIAQRTKDTPGALQYENVAPYEYFSRLVANFENDMLRYRQQIDETEQHLHATASSATLSPEDLSKAIRKIHEAFTSLAGRYQHIHDCIQEQKALYVKLHRQIYGVSTDIFDRQNASKAKPLKLIPTTEGPSPFIVGHRDPFTAARAHLTAQPQQSSLSGGPSGGSGGPPTLGLGATSSLSFGSSASSSTGTSLFNPVQTMQQTGIFGSTISPFNSASTASPFGNTSFGLAGNKRGKH